MIYLALYLLTGLIVALWGLWHFHRHNLSDFALAAVGVVFLWPIPLGVWLYHQWD